MTPTNSPDEPLSPFEREEVNRFVDEACETAEALGACLDLEVVDVMDVAAQSRLKYHAAVVERWWADVYAEAAPAVGLAFDDSYRAFIVLDGATFATLEDQGCRVVRIGSGENDFSSAMELLRAWFEGAPSALACIGVTTPAGRAGDIRWRKLGSPTDLFFIDKPL